MLHNVHLYCVGFLSEMLFFVCFFFSGKQHISYILQHNTIDILK